MDTGLAPKRQSHPASQQHQGVGAEMEYARAHLQAFHVGGQVHIVHMPQTKLSILVASKGKETAMFCDG